MVMKHDLGLPIHNHVSPKTHIWSLKNILTYVKRLFYPWDVLVGVTIPTLLMEFQPYNLLEIAQDTYLSWFALFPR